MKLLGRDIRSEELLEKVQARLQARGLWPEPEPPREAELVEPRVDPRGFNVGALEEHADPTRPLPLETHRAGLGQVVVVAKWAFRKTCQVFINEALSRQKLFNGHVRDSYAQLSAEVLRLRAKLDALEAAQAKPAKAEPVKVERAEAKPTEVESTKAKPVKDKARARTGTPRGAPVAKPKDSGRSSARKLAKAEAPAAQSTAPIQPELFEAPAAMPRKAAPKPQSHKTPARRPKRP